MYVKNPNEAVSLIRSIDKVEFVKPEWVLARFVASNILSNGFELRSENEKLHELWHSFNDKNQVMDKLWTTLTDNSINGWAVMTINKTEDGDIIWNLVYPCFTQNIGLNFVKPNTAVLYERFVIDQRNIILKNTYTTEYIKHEYYDENTNDEIDVNELRTKLPKGQSIEKITYHNLGFCPVEVIYNTPFTRRSWGLYNMPQQNISSSGNSNYSRMLGDYLYLSDTANCPGLPLVINEVYKQFTKELIFSKTRIITNETTLSTQQRYQDADQEFIMQSSDYIVNIDNNGGEFKVQQNNNKLGDYLETLSKLWEDLYNKCGFSIGKMSGGAQKSGTEVATLQDNSYKSMQIRINNLIAFVDRLLEKTFTWYKTLGKLDGDIKWTFEIREPKSQNEAQTVDKLIKLLNSNIITQVQAISEYKKIDEDDAAIIWENNKKFMEENMEYLNKINGTEEKENANDTKDTKNIK